MMRRRVAAGLAATALATGIGVTTATATASAAEVVSTPTGAVVWLNHAESVAAARSGIANFIDTTPAIRSQFAVGVSSKSRYAGTGRALPGHGATRYTSADLDALVAEAASHPTGRVALLIHPAGTTRPLGIAQYW